MFCIADLCLACVRLTFSTELFSPMSVVRRCHHYVIMSLISVTESYKIGDFLQRSNFPLASSCISGLDGCCVATGPRTRANLMRHNHANPFTTVPGIVVNYPLDSFATPALAHFSFVCVLLFPGAACNTAAAHHVTFCRSSDR